MRNGDWIQTYTGKQMYPLDPRADEIHIEDIAHSLAHLCRFNGHVKRFYSVAEHSYHVSQLLPLHLKLDGLLHHASEAYLCDLPGPIKRSAGFAERYIEAEERLMEVIAQKFNLQWPMPDEVHKADNALLGTEALQFMAPLHPEWKGLYGPVKGLILSGWNPVTAANKFLFRFKCLI